ncbi:MAG: DUF5652 family protein [Patescibacteria group bacterium]|jgi:methionyl-tRNA synthetase
MNFLPSILQNPAIFYALIAWSLVWKGVALWKSARANQRGWFVALLVVNTIGILEMIYIFLVSRKEPQA